ncbi:MAG: HIT family protein [bacterium]
MGTQDAGCVFCKIVAGELPGHKVYEDDDVLAFLDITPMTRGHTLVIPKPHHRNLLETPPAALESVTAAIPRIAEAVVEATDADGFNVLQSNEPCAGQCVFHVHFHVVPRHEGDGLGLGFRQSEPVEDDLEETAGAIRAAM